MQSPNAIGRLQRQVLRSAAVATIQAAARELIGGALLFLVRDGEEMVEVHPHESGHLPEFCRLYRSSPDGLDCCLSCRSLLGFAACYRGSIEYSCHGGVRILATSAPQQGEDVPRLVVATCAFARLNREKGWSELREHARGLGIDLRKLRAAYDRMPTLNDGNRKIAFSLIEIAASLIGELMTLQDVNGEPSPPSAGPLEHDDLQQVMSSALYLSRAQSSPHDEGPRGSLLADRVQNMISRHPAMPFTLKNVAQAARVSPNHLSTVFHQYAGVRFSDFLVTQRIALAKRLLRDLSLNIETVAQRTGFPNSSYFSRRFRMCAGKSPSQWRSDL